MPAGPVSISTRSDKGVDVDVAVLGAGTAGLEAYRAAAKVTDRVVLIDGGVAGTTCARVGCMPSKLLISAADAAHAAGEAGPFGIECAVRVDSRAVLERVRRERDRLVRLVLEGVAAFGEDHQLHDYARFVEPGVLQVGPTRVHARAVVIATGSSPQVPSILEDVRDRVVVSDAIFDWPSLPSSVAVIGTGAIGIELGQALRRLGVRVRMFGKGGALGSLTDPFVRESALSALRAELPIDPDAKLRAVKHRDDGVEIHFEDASGQVAVERFDLCLAAAGRKPNLSGLALERAGLRLDAKGIPVFDRTTMQCEGAPVFIAGDVSQDAPVLHEAVDEGRIAGENAARFPDVSPGLRRSRLRIVFSDPQIAVVGAAFSSLGEGVAIGEIDFGDQGRSRVMRQNRGKLRVYATPERFLGAEMVCPRAEHIGQLLGWAHQQKMTVGQMLTMPFYHPVVEEGLRTALRDVEAKLRKAGS